MTRILICGATGMLGHKLCHLLPVQGFDVVGTTRGTDDLARAYPAVFDQCEILTGVDALEDDHMERAICAAKPDVVVNCIGIVKQSAAATDPTLSRQINAELPHKLAELCAHHGARLIHISTDCVFAGTRGLYRESDTPDASDLYGQSKLAGETTADETNAITLRTSIIGRELDEPGHGLLSWFLSQRGRQVRGFARAVFSGLTTNEMARVVALVVRHPGSVSGVRHVAGPIINKYDLLQLIRAAYAVDIDIQRDEEVCVDRSLIMDRFTDEIGYVAPDWPTMIEQIQSDSTAYGRRGSPRVAQRTPLGPHGILHSKLTTEP